MSRQERLPDRRRVTSPTGRTADARRTIPLNSSRWRRIRVQVLTREPLCRMCAARGLEVLATDVDHISGDPSDNTAGNLQSLCHACHSHKTCRERAGFSVNFGCDASGLPLDPSHAWNTNEKSQGTGSV